MAGRLYVAFDAISQGMVQGAVTPTLLLEELRKTLVMGSRRSAARVKPAASRRLETNPRTRRFSEFITR